jgi:hypothetical protein
MEPLVAVEDVAGLWRPFTDAELGPAGNLIKVASAIIRARVPVDQMLADERVSYDVVAFVVKEMIADLVDATARPGAAKSISETTTTGPFSESTTISYDTVAAAASSMVLTDRLLGMLIPPTEADLVQLRTITLRPALAPHGDYSSRGRW